MKRFLFFLLLIIFSKPFFGQNHSNRFESVDIQHYIFEIYLNDSTNRIQGKTSITAKFIKPSKKFILDLIGTNDSTKTGMTISSVFAEGKSVNFIHINNQIQVNFKNTVESGETINIELKYSGEAGDGLIISKNKFGNRTFFGDNWPNRARHWLPTVDHPSDKATLEFKIHFPEQYNVVSNGILIEEKKLLNGFKYSHWKENIPISTKLMVIGVARFDILKNGILNGIPVTSWVFPENQKEGFYDFQDAIKSVRYFSDFIGPYSYEKLAHVQSKTRYGGMENASCIFYAERAITGEKLAERLIAHETAHQWFGNSVTEENWHHVWLSEGFATYLTHLYNLNFYGEKYFLAGLKTDRDKVIDFAEKRLAPVIDTTITDYIQLLNANSYQKASWFLHMLRDKIGEEAFQKSIQDFYLNFKDSTALTSDFQNIVENNSNLKLDYFFNQWLFQPGFPVLKIKWKQKNNNKIKLKIKQLQKIFTFSFPLEIEFQQENGKTQIETVKMHNKTNTFNIQSEGKIKDIQLDPNVKLLFN